MNSINLMQTTKLKSFFFWRPLLSRYCVTNPLQLEPRHSGLALSFKRLASLNSGKKTKKKVQRWPTFDVCMVGAHANTSPEAAKISGGVETAPNILAWYHPTSPGKQLGRRPLKSTGLTWAPPSVLAKAWGTSGRFLRLLRPVTRLHNVERSVTSNPWQVLLGFQSSWGNHGGASGIFQFGSIKCDLARRREHCGTASCWQSAATQRMRNCLSVETHFWYLKWTQEVAKVLTLPLNYRHLHVKVLILCQYFNKVKNLRLNYFFYHFMFCPYLWLGTTNKTTHNIF